MPPRNKKGPTPIPMPELNFLNRGPQYTVVPSSGLVVTDEMKEILAQPGLLNLKNGGERFRYLYMNQSLGFHFSQLPPFGQACFCGALSSVMMAVESSLAPDLGTTETPYKWGYASHVINGSQRVWNPPNEPGCPKTEHLEVLQYLISRGLPLDVPDIAGYTALHHAVMGESIQHKEDLIRVLIESGADVNSRDRWGSTPLLAAITRGDILGIELLMEYGADVDIKDGDGMTALACYVHWGPQVTAAMQKWLRRRAGGTPAPLSEKKCDNCMARDKPLKKCAKCRTVQYCSRECQRAAWSVHKKECQPFTSSTTATLIPHYNYGENGTLMPISSMARGMLGLPSKPIPSSHLKISSIPKNLPAEGKQLVLKIQIPEDASSPYQEMLVYTKKRDFVCCVSRASCPRAYDQVSDVVKRQGVQGKKGYFAADLKGKHELVVKISEPLGAQPW